MFLCVFFFFGRCLSWSLPVPAGRELEAQFQSPCCRQGISDQWELRPPRFLDWAEKSLCGCWAGVNVVGVKSYDFV